MYTTRREAGKGLVRVKSMCLTREKSANNAEAFNMWKCISFSVLKKCFFFSKINSTWTMSRRGSDSELIERDKLFFLWACNSLTYKVFFIFSKIGFASIACPRSFSVSHPTAEFPAAQFEELHAKRTRMSRTQTKGTLVLRFVQSFNRQTTMSSALIFFSPIFHFVISPGEFISESD